MCQHLSTSTLHQLLNIVMAVRCCICLEQRVTMLKRFWLFMVKSQPHFILQECTAMLAFDGHGMFKHRSISAEEHYTCDLQSTWTVPCNFLPWWHLAHYSAFCCFSWGSSKCIHDMSLKFDWGMRWLDFSDAAGGRWQEEHTWLFGHLGACVESTYTNFCFRKLLVRIW